MPARRPPARKTRSKKPTRTSKRATKAVREAIPITEKGEDPRREEGREISQGAEKPERVREVLR